MTIISSKLFLCAQSKAEGKICFHEFQSISPTLPCFKGVDHYRSSLFWMWWWTPRSSNSSSFMGPCHVVVKVLCLHQYLSGFMSGEAFCSHLQNGTTLHPRYDMAIKWGNACKMVCRVLGIVGRLINITYYFYDLVKLVGRNVSAGTARDSWLGIMCYWCYGLHLWESVITQISCAQHKNNDFYSSAEVPSSVVRICRSTPRERWSKVWHYSPGLWASWFWN